ARFDREGVFVAVLVDGNAVDELEHEILLAVLSHARVEQPRDVRVRELREVARLAREALGRRGAGTVRQQLQGHFALVAAVAADGARYGAHSALPDGLRQPVLPVLLPGFADGARRAAGAAHEAGHAEALRQLLEIGGGALGGFEHRLDFRTQRSEERRVGKERRGMRWMKKYGKEV